MNSENDITAGSEILVVGLAVIDLLFEVAEMPARAEKYIARDARAVGGGGAANAAVAVSHLQGRARLAARVGDDLFGDLTIRQLVDESVDCSLVQKTEAARSSFSSVLIDQAGERQIVNFRGCGLSDDASLLSNIKVDAVLADTRWQTGTLEAMRLARRLGVPGVIDAEAPVDAALLELASHVAFSRQGLLHFSGQAQLQAALLTVSNQIDAWVCVTDGENGVYFVDDGAVHNVPVRAVDVVDTLGAGDVWHAAFVYALAQKKTEYTAMEFANAAASLKCSRRGGGRNSPTLDEVIEYISRSRCT